MFMILNLLQCLLDGLRSLKKKITSMNIIMITTMNTNIMNVTVMKEIVTVIKLVIVRRKNNDIV